MKKKLGAYVLMICMLLTAAPISANASGNQQEEGIYEIASTSEFRVFAKKCRDAQWSYGREVHLKKDISFNKETFLSVPYFAGIFDGEGHTISGVKIKGNVSKSGIFSETAVSTCIRNLTVKGTIRPGGSQEKTGGIVGDNAGRIVNCEFHGKIRADNETGGIAGNNQAAGRIRSCRVYGFVEGIVDVGGIAGINDGLIRGCKNHAAVNASQREESVSEDQITAILERISMSGEVDTLSDTTTITDVGGITGLNKGTVEDCKNSGTVGYQYIGYNIGGIAGRSSGMISAGKNSGDIYGRKDVGGITGQLQPYLLMEYAQDELEKLQDELGRLNQLVNSAGEDAKSYSARTTENLNQLSRLLKEAENSANELVNGGLSYADSLTEQTNRNFGQIQKSAKNLSSVMDELQDGLNQMEGSAESLVKQTEEFIDAVKMAPEDKEIVSDALKSMQAGMNRIAGDGDRLAEAVKKLSEDLDTLQSDIDTSGWSAEKAAAYTRMLLEDVKNINQYVEAISYSLNNELIPAASDISSIITRYAVNFSDEAAKVREPLGNFMDAMEAVLEIMKPLSDDIKALTEMLNEGIAENPVGTVRIDSTGAISFDISLADIISSETMKNFINDLGDFGNRMDALYSATQALNDAVRNFYNNVPMSQEDKTSLISDHAIIQKAADDISQNGNGLQTAINTFLADLDIVQTDMEQNVKSVAVIKKDIVRLKEDCDMISDYATDMTSALNQQMIPAMNDLSSLVIKYGDGPDNTELRNAIDGMMDSITEMPDTVGDVSSLLGRLNEKLNLDIEKLDDSTRDFQESLYQSMLDAGEQMDAITGDLGDGTNQLTTDLQDISNKFHECMDILIDAVQDIGSTDIDPMEHVEDLSQEILTENEITELKSGRVTGSVNRGMITGSLDLGGIAGTVGIESDLNPENDIVSSGTNNGNYAFQSKCIIDKCLNYGEIAARKNNLGGIVGQMNLGLITGCGNYGDLSSESGSYIGGLAGFSRSAVRNSFSRGSLSGARYIGGAVGYGYIVSDVVTMVCIPDAEQEYGAIAGAVSDRDEQHLHGNLFVSEPQIVSKYRSGKTYGAQAGIGNVSFPEIAEEITYQQLMEKEDVPKEFKAMTLTFEAEDEVVKALTCEYGTKLKKKKIPKVPKKEGYTGEWDRKDFSDIKGDDTVRAVYSIEITTLSSKKKRDGKQSVLLVNGSFGKDEKLVLASVDAKEEETERWHVTLTEKGKHEFRFLPVEADTALYLEKDGKKTVLKTDAYGKYLTFTTEETDFILVSESEKRQFEYYWAVVPILAAALAVLLWKRKLGRKKKTLEQQGGGNPSEDK